MDQSNEIDNEMDNAPERSLELSHDPLIEGLGAATGQEPSTSTATTDCRRWFPFRETNDSSGLPPALYDLFVTCAGGAHEKLSLTSYIYLLTHLAFIETGFLPVRENFCLPSANEIVSEPVECTMNRSIDILKNIIEEKISISNIPYKVIKQNTDSTSVNSVDFTNDLINVIVWKNRSVNISVTTRGVMKDSYVIPNHLVAGLSCSDEAHIEDLIKRSDCLNVLRKIKINFCIPLMFKLGGVNVAANRGLDTYPREMIEKLAEHLDIRCIISLKRTCNWLNIVLDSEKIWEAQCRRIKTDLVDYELPMPEDIDNTLNDMDLSSKDKCQKIYEDAIALHKQELALEMRNAAFFYPPVLDLDG